MENLIVYAPHVCVVSPILDPGCDFRSRIYAKILAARLKGKLILSRTLRAECDNNRIMCRETPSRRRLRESITPDTFVLEVHTFSPYTSRWRSRSFAPEPEVVILTTGNEEHARFVAYNISKAGFDIEVLRGDREVNDVQKEVGELHANGMLLELSQNLTLAQVKIIGSVMFT